MKRFLQAPRRLEGQSVIEHLRATIAWNKTHPVRYRIHRFLHLAWKYLKDPRPLARGPYYVITEFIHRGRHGWAASDAWAIDHYLDKIIPPMIDKMRTDCHGYPGEFEPLGEEAATAVWDDILAQIAMGFRAHAELGGIPGSARAELEATFEKGMALFVKWYDDLWD